MRIVIVSKAGGLKGFWQPGTLYMTVEEYERMVVEEKRRHLEWKNKGMKKLVDVFQ